MSDLRIGILGPFNPAFISDYLEESNVAPINGAATAVNTLVREFLEQGYSLKIFTLSNDLPNEYKVLKGKNVEVHLIPTGMLPHYLGNRQWVLGQFYLPNRIANVAEKEIDKLDVLHAHWTYEYARAASLLSDRIPVFDTVRDWCPYQLTLMKGRSRLDWRLKYFTFRKVMADKNITFIANSTYTHKMITVAYPEKDVPIIPNPIDKKWILNEKKKLIQHQFISIAIGLMGPRKNIGKLLEAFSLYKMKHSEASLHLVGGYDENNDVFIQWKNNGLLDGVVLHGALPHDELASLLDKMSCLVHPSLEETFGNILLEAMARCVPCIGGDNAGAVPDVLGHGKYGLLCDINNPQAIYEAMIKMSDLSVASKIQRNATERLKQSYSSDTIVNKHIEVFKKYIINRNFKRV